MKTRRQPRLANNLQVTENVTEEDQSMQFTQLFQIGLNNKVTTVPGKNTYHNKLMGTANSDTSSEDIQSQQTHSNPFKLPGNTINRNNSPLPSDTFNFPRTFRTPTKATLFSIPRTPRTPMLAKLPCLSDLTPLLGSKSDNCMLSQSDTTVSTPFIPSTPLPHQFVTPLSQTLQNMLHKDVALTPRMFFLNRYKLFYI